MTVVQGVYQRAPTGIFQSIFANNAGNQSYWNTCPIPSMVPLTQEATISFDCANRPGPKGEPSGRYRCNSTSVFAEFFGAPNCTGAVVNVASIALGCNPGTSGYSDSPAFNLSCALFVLRRHSVRCLAPRLPCALSCPSLTSPPPHLRPAASASPSPTTTDSLAGKTCGGSSLPSTEAPSPITCFYGAVNGSAPYSYAQPRLHSSFTNGEPHPRVCGAYTITTDGKAARFYGGLPSLSSVSSVPASISDIVLCTTDKCNNPTADACATANGVLPVLSSMLCGGAPTSGVPPTPASSNIKCFNNINASSTTLQTAASGNLCATLTHLCQVDDPFPSCAGQVGNAVRVYSDVATLAAIGAFQSSFGDIGSIVPIMYAGYLFSSNYPARTLVNDLSLCNTEGCNAPAADACALATVPITAAVVFNMLPTSAVNATSGTLTDAAKTLLTNSIKAAVAANGCATCTVTLQRVVDSAGNTLYSAAARRLQTGAVTVTFSTVGGSQAALNAVVAAASAPSFTSAVAAAVAQSGGAAYAGVAVSAPPVPAAPSGSGPSTTTTASWQPLGLLGLLSLLVVAPAVWWCYIKAKEAGAPPAKKAEAPPAKLVLGELAPATWGPPRRAPHTHFKKAHLPRPPALPPFVAQVNAQV